MREKMDLSPARYKGFDILFEKWKDPTGYNPHAKINMQISREGVVIYEETLTASTRNDAFAKAKEIIINNMNKLKE